VSQYVYNSMQEWWLASHSADPVKDAGYSFWCSKCKDSHAGECPPDLSLKTWRPVGSRWYCDVKIGDYEWNTQRVRPMTVISHHFDLGKVTFQYDGSPTKHVLSFDMFAIDGTPSLELRNEKVRFIRPAPALDTKSNP
jgi:hypothetical protein